MYVNASDLQDLYTGDLSSGAINKWISKAEIRLAAQIRRRGGDLAVLATDPALLPMICDVIENVVLDFLNNPRGLKSESEGDYSYTLADPTWGFPAADLDLIYSGSSVRSVWVC